MGILHTCEAQENKQNPPERSVLPVEVKADPCPIYPAKTMIKTLQLKPHFFYVQPLLANDNNQLHNDTIVEFTQSSESVQELPEYRQSLSLQEMIDSMEKANMKNKIAVQWHSFVKIKAKNYLEDYIFMKEIGHGAYGVVIKIKMKYGGFLRAAKLIKSQTVLKSSSIKTKLIAEISIPLKLDHPNLIKLYQIFEWKQQYVVIMQLCEGGDLFRYIKQSKVLSDFLAAQLIKQILSAVYYMHKQNVVHRDLKPQNILIDTSSMLVVNDYNIPTLKIIDFGTAVYHTNGKKLSSVVGTPYYLAPEVIQGRYDEKCDVWSCGVILYIMLCGAPPFNGRNEKEIMENITMKPLQFPQKIWSRRSKTIKALVSRMLCKNPVERISAQQALNSTCLSNPVAMQQHQMIEQVENQVINNLRHFHFKNKLKAVVYTYIASQLYSSKDKQKLLKVFRDIDKDGDGVIARDQLVKVFEEQGRTNLSKEQIGAILQLIDTNGSGQIDFTEFLVAASNQSKLLQNQRLQNAFSYLDADHNGYITINEVKEFLDGTEQTSDEIKKIFDEVDENGDGEISKKEFVLLLTRM